MIPSLCGWVLLALSLGASTPSGAEDVELQDISFGEEILVTATAREEKDFDLPYSTFVLTGEDLRHRQMARTVPEALDEVPGVMVQIGRASWRERARAAADAGRREIAEWR